MNELQTTPEEEWSLCASSFTYFHEKYLKFRCANNVYQTFGLFDYQKRYIECIESNQFVIATKFRQGGFTTVVLSWLLWRLLFKNDETSVVLCKDRRSAEHNAKLVFDMVENLPEFLKNSIYVVQSKAMLGTRTHSKLKFCCIKMTRGFNFDNLFIDEAAFVSDLKYHWISLFPALSRNGHCIAISTPCHKNGWFYETYRDATQGTNSFKAFRAEYTEHPEYSHPAWIAETKARLGDKTWRQEILQQFEGEELTAVETKTVKQLELDFEPEVKKEMWSIEHNDPFKNQSDLFDPLDEDANQGWKPKPETYQFKNMTKEQSEAFVQNYLAKSKPVEPLSSMDSFDLDPDRGLQDFLEAYDTTFMPKKQMENLSRPLSPLRKWTQELEERINENVVDDQLFMAGLDVERSGCKVVPSKAILDEIQTKFADLKLKFREDRLYVNGAPTIILEDDVRDLYNGTLAFESPEAAISSVCNVLEKRLATIFCQVSE